MHKIDIYLSIHCSFETLSFRDSNIFLTLYFRDNVNPEPEQRGDEAEETIDPGPTHPVPLFRPERQPGLHLPACHTREQLRSYLRPVDFFCLFFTQALVQNLCDYTNKYAESVGATKLSMYNRWENVEVDEFYMLIGLLMYMSVVKVPRFVWYWSEETLLNGLWARRFMSVWRYKCLMSFLKVSDIETENSNDRLGKARFLLDEIKTKCSQLFQPYQNVSIDERMVKNKGRYSFRQYIRDKPTKWGMKLWVLADSKSGYTYNFDVYLGKENNLSSFGLAYTVVMNLVTSLVNQGYHLFFDNFYTGIQLMKDLVARGIRACGTVLVNRKGFPAGLKNVKEWEKKAKRGDVRWERDGDILAMQWKDNKTVSFLSTIHQARKTQTVVRRSKENGQFRKLEVNQPELVKDYNKNMNGVDLSDQLIGKYNCLRKTNKWWKTLFLHCIDIARVNSYILFQEFRAKNQDIPELKRSAYYNQLDFTIELIRQLGGLLEDEEVPVRQRKIGHHAQRPYVTKKRSNCNLCYKKGKVFKVQHYCKVCGLFFCLQKGRNCMDEAHLEGGYDF